MFRDLWNVSCHNFYMSMLLIFWFEIDMPGFWFSLFASIWKKPYNGQWYQVAQWLRTIPLMLEVPSSSQFNRKNFPEIITWYSIHNLISRPYSVATCTYTCTYLIIVGHSRDNASRIPIIITVLSNQVKVVTFICVYGHTYSLACGHKTNVGNTQGGTTLILRYESEFRSNF